MSELTAKQQRFVEEYLLDLNATQAAIRAGYAESGARTEGARLLANADIEIAITAAQKARSERTQIDADWVLRRLALEAQADLAELYDEKGVLKPVKDWPLIWRQGLVAGLETKTEFVEVDGVNKADGMVHKIKLSDRIRRVELIGKHVAVGAFVDRLEHTGKDGGPIETVEVGEFELARRIALILDQATRQPTH